MDRNRYYEQERKVSQVHGICYRDFTIKVKKERAKDRYEDASRLSDASLVQRKAGRRLADVYMTWSLLPKANGQRMLYVTEKYDDEETFYRRMNHIMSAK